MEGIMGQHTENTPLRKPKPGKGIRMDRYICGGAKLKCTCGLDELLGKGDK